MYVLQVCSTGETIKSDVSDLSLTQWHKRTEKKLLRLKRTPERVRESILSGDTVAGVLGTVRLTDEQCKFIFRGYDKFYESRLKC